MEDIEKIHTTPLGIMRIKRNLELDTDDIVSWCKKEIKKSKSKIKKGKNWYIYSENSIITINASSYTIITAHKNK